MELIIGSHVSYKNDSQLLGSVKEAISYGENTFMFYTGAPQNTNRGAIKKELTSEAYDMMKDNNIDINNVVVHAPYIVNLANIDNFDFSVSFLKGEVERCAELGIKKMVLHPGSAVNCSREEAIINISDGLNLILDNDYDVTILLETMAGKGNEVGKSFEELKAIIDRVKYQDKIGVCIDTCHLNDAGYDMSDFDSILDLFDNIIGINKIGCIHVNDSKNVIASHKDRHENIGFGTIGFDNLINIIYNERLEGIPRILETPYVTKDDNSKDKVYPPYKYEIEMIRNKEFDNDLINKITTVGPHRDDMEILINGKSARLYGSQGQQRSCVLALKLAEASLLKEMTDDEPLALLDDVMSELDESRQDYILNHIKNWQVFITCCDANTVLRLKKGKTFHIENGRCIS